LDKVYKTFKSITVKNTPIVIENASPVPKLMLKEGKKESNSSTLSSPFDQVLKKLTPRTPKSPRSPKFEDESGDEVFVEAETNSDKFPPIDNFQNIYNETKGKEFLVLSTNHGRTFYSGEDIEGYVVFNSEIETRPIILITCHKRLQYSRDVDQFESNVYFLNHKINCSKSPCYFKIKIPNSTTFGSHKFDVSDLDGEIFIKYQIQIMMIPKKNLMNLYGLFTFSSKLPLIVYPKPLIKEMQQHYNPFFLLNSKEESNMKKYKLSLMLQKKVYQSGEDAKVTVSFVNPNGKHDILIHSFHLYLCQQIEINFDATKEEDKNSFEFSKEKPKRTSENQFISRKININKICLGQFDNQFKNFISKEASTMVKIPRDLYVNEDVSDDLKVNYSIQIIASLFDYQIKGPIVESDILISSPILSEERISKLGETKKDQLVKNEKIYTPKDSAIDALTGMKF
jgi:hypothetical protein